jgi:hypothetical protein
MAEDDVQLTDLELIQRWSLAVRTATADRADVIAALRADLAWLEGRRSARRPSASSDGADVDEDSSDEPPVRRRPRTAATPARTAAPARKPTANKTSAKKASAKKASAKKTTARAGRRTSGRR